MSDPSNQLVRDLRDEAVDSLERVRTALDVISGRSPYAAFMSDRVMEAVVLLAFAPDDVPTDDPPWTQASKDPADIIQLVPKPVTER